MKYLENRCRPSSRLGKNQCLSIMLKTRLPCRSLCNSKLMIMNKLSTYKTILIKLFWFYKCDFRPNGSMFIFYILRTIRSWILRLVYRRIVQQILLTLHNNLSHYPLSTTLLNKVIKNYKQKILSSISTFALQKITNVPNDNSMEIL